MRVFRSAVLYTALALGANAAGADTASLDALRAGDMAKLVLAKDPAARPQSCRQLSAELARLALLMPWTQEQARQWWEVNRPAIPRRVTPQPAARPERLIRKHRAG